MNYLISASVLTALLAPYAAQASDINLKKVPAATIANNQKNFDGAYIGGNIGVGFINTSMFSPAALFDGFPVPDTNVGSYSGKDSIGGVQIGYDTRYGDYVFGVQGMFDFASINSSALMPGYPAETVGAEMRSFSTISTRAGVLLQPTLLAYVKGGLAFAKFDYSDDYNDGAYEYAGSASAYRTGWTVGAGLEYVIEKNWTAFIEYNHADFGTKLTTLNYDLISDDRTTVFTQEYTHKVDAGLFGVNYRF